MFSTGHIILTIGTGGLYAPRGFVHADCGIRCERKQPASAGSFTGCGFTDRDIGLYCGDMQQEENGSYHHHRC